MKIVNIFVALAVSIFLGIILIYVNLLSPKILSVFLIAIILVIAFMITGSIKKLLIGVLIFSFGMQLDFNPWYSAYNFRPNIGVSLSLTEISLLLLYLLWYFELSSGKRKAVKTSPDIFILLFLVFYTAISFFVTDKIGFTIFQFPKVIAVFLIYYYSRRLIDGEKTIDFIVLISSLVILFTSIIGISQFASKGLFSLPFLGSANKAVLLQYSKSEIFRISGFLGHPNLFANYLICWLPLMYFVFSMTKNRREKYLCLFAYCLGVVCLILTFSRGGWISFGIVQLLAIVMLTIKKSQHVMKILVKTGIAVFLLSLAILPFAVKIYQRLAYYDFGAGQSRLMLLKESLAVISEHPFTGLGLGHFMDFNPPPAHNIYLHMATEIGLPALILFLWLSFEIFKKGLMNLKCRDEKIYMLSSGLLLGFIAFLIHGLFEPGTIGDQRFILIFFIGGLIVSANMLCNSYRSQGIDK